MRAPFARPFFAGFFYWYAGISTVIGVLIVLIFPQLLQRIIGPNMGVFLGTVSGAMAGALVVQGIGVAAIGYVIELIAKIEWNTRPQTDAMGYVVGSAPAFAPHGGKQYYYSLKGQTQGPFTAPQMLQMYQAGQISVAAQLYVEENGQRRILKNWSEIGL